LNFYEIEHPDGPNDIIMCGMLRKKSKRERKLSIIMPNYNNEKYLDESIDSVINQTHQNWELIIVDDCSTDNSVKVIKKYLKDKRIKLFKNRKNKGVAETRNKCISQSKSNIIVQVDPDDYIEPIALEVINNEFSSDRDLTLLFSDLNRIIDGKKYPTKQRDIQNFNDWRVKPRAFHISAFKKSAVNRFGGYNKNLKTCEDINFYYKIFENKLKHKYIPMYLYNWRINPNSLCNTNKLECVNCSYGKDNCIFYKNFKKMKLIN